MKYTKNGKPPSSNGPTVGYETPPNLEYNQESNQEFNREENLEASLAEQASPDKVSVDGDETGDDETVGYISHREVAGEAAKYFFEQLGEERVSREVLRSTVDAFEPFVADGTWDTLRLYIDFVFTAHPEDKDPAYWLPKDAENFIRCLRSDKMKKQARHWLRKLSIKKRTRPGGIARYFEPFPEYQGEPNQFELAKQRARAQIPETINGEPNFLLRKVRQQEAEKRAQKEEKVEL